MSTTGGAKYLKYSSNIWTETEDVLYLSPSHPKFEISLSCDPVIFLSIPHGIHKAGPPRSRVKLFLAWKKSSAAADTIVHSWKFNGNSDCLWISCWHCNRVDILTFFLIVIVFASPRTLSPSTSSNLYDVLNRRKKGKFRSLTLDCRSKILLFPHHISPFHLSWSSIFSSHFKCSPLLFFLFSKNTFSSTKPFKMSTWYWTLDSSCLHSASVTLFGFSFALSARSGAHLKTCKVLIGMTTKLELRDGT